MLSVRYPVSSYLASGQMYFMVASRVFHVSISSFWDLLQVFTQRGFYALDSNDEPVTEKDLLEMEPFKLVCYLSLWYLPFDLAFFTYHLKKFPF